MNILAVDTTGAFASAAVRNRENIIYSETSGREMNHLQALFPMIERVLEASGTKKDQLEMIAVSIGPGSFTGIRIGIAAARTIAQALDLPMVAVPTLASFAYAESQEQKEKGQRTIMVCPVLDARRSQVYGAAYVIEDGKITEKIAPAAMDVNGFIRNASDAAAEAGISCMRFYGDGSDSYAGAISEISGIMTETAPEEIRYQNAVSVLYAAEAIAQADGSVSYDQVRPEYLRKSEAERKLAAGQLGKKKKNLKKARPETENDIPVPPADEKISYRTARTGDVKAFAELDGKCFTSAWSQSAFTSELDGSKPAFYVAAENSRGEVIGFAGAAYIVDEGEVNRVAVHPLYRGRGIADHMMDMLGADAVSRNMAALILEVREANGSAIALYKSHGFTVVGKREGYYAQTGENALLMRCELGGERAGS